MAALLSFGDLNGSLRNLDRLYEKAGFNDEAKFGILCNAVIEHLELAQFAICSFAKTYKALFDMIMSFWFSHCAFQAAAGSLRNSSYHASENAQGMYEPRSKVESKTVIVERSITTDACRG